MDYKHKYNKYRTKYSELSQNIEKTNYTCPNNKPMIINRIIELLKNNYVFPNKIPLLNKLLLSNLKNGKYDELEDIQLFKQLYDDIFSVLQDKHIYFRKNIKSNIKSNEPTFDNQNWMQSKILNNNIGIILLKDFAPFDMNKKEIIKMTIKHFNTIKKCNKIVFDLRKTKGG